MDEAEEGEKDSSDEQTGDYKLRENRSNSNEDSFQVARQQVNIKIEEDIEVVVPPYLIHPNSRFKLVWAFFIFTIVMQTTIVMPLRIAWPESFNSGFWNGVDISSDVIFVFDVGFNFLYVQEDSYGGFILNLKELALEYLKSWFIVDCVSSVPISVIMISLSSTPTNQSNIMSIKFIKLLKLFTLYRLLTLARVTRLFKNNKMVEYLISKINISRDV